MKVQYELSLPWMGIERNQPPGDAASIGLCHVGRRVSMVRGLLCEASEAGAGVYAFIYVFCFTWQ